MWKCIDCKHKFESIVEFTNHKKNIKECIALLREQPFKDTELLRKLKKEFIVEKDRQFHCASCNYVFARLDEKHQPGCVVVELNSRIAKFQ